MMQSSSPSSVSSHPSSTFMAHSGALSGASGGFALDSAATDPRGVAPNRNRLERMVHDMERSLPLPTSPRGYLLFLCWLVLTAGGMAILTLMSAQNLEARVELRRLNNEHTLIQQRNAELVWLIARETNLERIQRRLAGQGYVPATQVEYVVLGGQRPAQALPAAASESSTAEESIATAPPSSREPIVAAVLPSQYGRQTAAPTQSQAPNQEIAPAANNFAPAAGMQPDRDPALSTSAPESTGGWLDALAQGIVRWESIFRDNQLERATPPLRSQEAVAGEAASDTGLLNWGWDWALPDSLPAWNELLSWWPDMKAN